MKDQELLQNIVCELVNVPEDVRIEKTIDDMGILLTLHVNPRDMGVLLGRKGETITAIRKIMKPVGFKHGSRISIKVHDPNYQNNYQ